jgi:hypothetical protein
MKNKSKSFIGFIYYHPKYFIEEYKLKNKRKESPSYLTMSVRSKPDFYTSQEYPFVGRAIS